MINCPICNRLTEDGNWCNDCFKEANVRNKDIIYFAEWAANRAREFERDRAKVLVEALELELETLGANAMKAMELKDKEIERLKIELRESIKRGAWLQGELTETKGQLVVLKYGGSK